MTGDPEPLLIITSLLIDAADQALRVPLLRHLGQMPVLGVQ